MRPGLQILQVRSLGAVPRCLAVWPLSPRVGVHLSWDSLSETLGPPPPAPFTVFQQDHS